MPILSTKTTEMLLKFIVFSTNEDDIWASLFSSMLLENVNILWWYYLI